ncbi:hypothetical protein CA13_16560 [Planctomycetes bacterium CA13]|uniref:FG-GAP repeat protein n=1 Tax=Novipirellula herctigrandis TaxID=2527986 RepID=A0A5C5Z0M3_9BACT|nr:hypothetical protein CA13_16560 [Planctomycetes bacterium CA13]
MTSKHLIASMVAIAIGCSHSAVSYAETPDTSSRSEEWKRHSIDTTSLGVDGVRSADVNGDGLPDLVCGWEQGGVYRIYLMQRKPESLPRWIHVDAGAAPAVEDALLVDLDQDGAIEVVSSTEGNHRKVLVHWAPPPTKHYPDSSLWKTETLFENGSRWMFAVAMDVDGRHGPDVMVGGKRQGGSIGWLESPANPRDTNAWKFHKLTDATWTMSIICRDSKGDGLSSKRKRTTIPRTATPASV